MSDRRRAVDEDVAAVRDTWDGEALITVAR